MAKLYIVPTPIGNLKDITLRAIEVLRTVDYILCEDTQNTMKLLKLLHIDIDKSLLHSFHKFNEASKLNIVIENIKNGSSYALVSDAGTPCISDPGQRLVKLLKEQKIPIEVLPGANSITTALSGSGLLFNDFYFIGFLDRTETKITNRIKECPNSLIVAFESPHRIQKTIKLLSTKFKKYKVTIARELSKLNEEIITGLPETFVGKDIRGEIVIIIDKRK